MNKSFNPAFSFTVLLSTFLMSCTSAPVTVRPEGCRSQAFYSQNVSNKSHRSSRELESKYWSVFGGRDLTLLELLAQKDIKCEELGAISYSVSQNATDVLLSLLPGISRGTIKIQVQDADVVQYYEPIRIAQTPILMPRKDVAPIRSAPAPTTFQTRKKGHLGVFYESLQGGFSQTDIASDAGADLEQGAPVGFGLSGSYELSSNITFNSRLSLAKVSKANFGEFGEANLPFELNLRALIKYRQPGSLYRFGGGIDHERFSLFNNTELKSGADVEAYQSSVTFAVVELERFFDLLDLPAQVSFLAGPSVISSSTYSYLEGTSLSGIKFQFQFSFSPAPSWQTYFSYKLMQLSGESEVGIERLGLGLSYDFF